MLACFFLLYRTIPNDLTACSLTASLGISFAWIERKCDIYIKDCYMNATIKKIQTGEIAHRKDQQ